MGPCVFAVYPEAISPAMLSAYMCIKGTESTIMGTIYTKLLACHDLFCFPVSMALCHIRRCMCTFSANGRLFGLFMIIIHTSNSLQTGKFHATNYLMVAWECSVYIIILCWEYTN